MRILLLLLWFAHLSAGDNMIPNRVEIDAPHNAFVGKDIVIRCSNPDEYDFGQMTFDNRPFLQFQYSNNVNESETPLSYALKMRWLNHTQISGADSTYIIVSIKATADDGGKYQCVYYVNGSTIYSSKRKVVIVRAAGDPSLKVMPLSVSENNIITVKCTADTGVPAGVLHLSRGDRSRLYGNVSVIKNLNGTWMTQMIHFKAQVSDNNQQIICRTYNEIDPMPKVVKSPPINVFYTVRDFIVTPRKDVYLPKSRIRCAASGNPPPQITWRKVEGDASFAVNGSELIVGDTIGFYLYECQGNNVVNDERTNGAVMLSFRVPSPAETGVGINRVGIKVTVTSNTKSTWDHQQIALIAGGAVAFLVCLIALAIVIGYILWQRRHYQKP